MKRLFLILILFSVATSGQAQNYNDSLVTIKGQVLDTNYSVGFYNLVVLNKTVGKGIFGEYTGRFSITLKKSDTIGISVRGYQTIYVSYRDSSYKKVYNDKFYIQPLEYTAEEVIVRPLKTLEELKDADSAFFTGTAAEVVGLQSLDEYEFPMEWNQSLGFQLMKLYKEEVLGLRHKKILVTR